MTCNILIDVVQYYQKVNKPNPKHLKRKVVLCMYHLHLDNVVRAVNAIKTPPNIESHSRQSRNVLFKVNRSECDSHVEQ